MLLRYPVILTTLQQALVVIAKQSLQIIYSTSTPGVETSNPAQQAFRCMVTFPNAGDIFIGLGHGWINMNSAEQFVQANIVFHRQHEFSQ